MTNDPLPHLLALPEASIPDDVMAVLRLSMLDWMACGIAGAGEPVAQACRAMVRAEGGAAQAHLFGGGQEPARAAALVNGAASHALDYDDTHFAHIGHPSVAVLPTVLAVAEAHGASGADLQRAACLGVEASVRMGVWLGRGHYQIGFHQTATAGAFGATLAAGQLMQLNSRQMAHALSLTATRAAGLKAQFGTDGKPYNAGLAAQTGVECAALAHAGMTSAPHALAAFGATHQGADAPWPETWLWPDVSHKYHACCHGLHATLEALAQLPLSAEMEAIEITTHPRWMSVCNQQSPTKGLGAKFSYSTVAAMACLGISTADPGSYTDALTARADLQALRRRVSIREDASLTETEARVSLTIKGETHHATHDLLAPQPISARTERVRAKAASLIGAAHADRLWSLITENAAPKAMGAALTSLS